MVGWILIAIAFIPLAYLIEYVFKERIKNARASLVVGFWFAVNALDAHSSFLFISKFGSEREGNLIIRVLVEEFGMFFGLIVMKGGVVLLLGVLFLFLAKSTGDKILCLTGSMIILLIAIWNYVNYFLLMPYTTLL